MNKKIVAITVDSLNRAQGRGILDCASGFRLEYGEVKSFDVDEVIRRQAAQIERALQVVSAISIRDGRLPDARAIGKGEGYKQFLAGAARMEELTSNSNPKANPALLIALIIAEMVERKGYRRLIPLARLSFLFEMDRFLYELFAISLDRHRKVYVQHPTQRPFSAYRGTFKHARKGLNDALGITIGFKNPLIQDIPVPTWPAALRTLAGLVVDTVRRVEREYIHITLDRNDEYNAGMLFALKERIITLLDNYWLD